MTFTNHDDPDSRHSMDKTGQPVASAAMVRLRAAITAGLGFIADARGNDAKAFASMRRYVVALDLIPSRINRLRSIAHSESIPGMGPWPKADSEKRLDGVCTWGEWRAAARLVMRAALSVLVEVPLRSSQDAYDLIGLLLDAPGALAKAQQVRAIDKAHRYLVSAITGEGFKTDHALTYTGRKWGAYRQGDILALAPSRSPKSGADHVFVDKAGARILATLERATSRSFQVQTSSGSKALARKAWEARYRVTARFAGEVAQ